MLSVTQMLEKSPYTWSETLIDLMDKLVVSEQFVTNLMTNRWHIDVSFLEKIAKDQVISGYFSD